MVEEFRFFDKLPQELQLQVLSNSKLDDIINLCKTSNFHENICSSNIIIYNCVSYYIIYNLLYNI
ncbi:F-box domain-containing protein [Orpheovirus IHUMI-LCC2]|uniref:F-box domain-containing protein n=1 Tax=Orpheovirus IHUMI-LCC2 TaxID=2023057 RepID=A0A2I2L5R2_9VIRU|nr:F-box domain-containing protein [Orpheovirus IHUMI-LCC2]SNW62867.1 F-box domain-containing protein [Orpheovirus IHUMI-LCC2]